MPRTPAEPALLDDDVLETPRWLTPEDLYAEGGPGWRQRGAPLFEMEEDQ